MVEKFHQWNSNLLSFSISPASPEAPGCTWWFSCCRVSPFLQLHQKHLDVLGGSHAIESVKYLTLKYWLDKHKHEVEHITRTIIVCSTVVLAGAWLPCNPPEDCVCQIMSHYGVLFSVGQAAIKNVVLQTDQ